MGKRAKKCHTHAKNAQHATSFDDAVLLKIHFRKSLHRSYNGKDKSHTKCVHARLPQFILITFTCELFSANAKFRIWSKHIMAKIARINIEFIAKRKKNNNNYSKYLECFHCVFIRHALPGMLEKMFYPLKITLDNLIGIFILLLQFIIYLWLCIRSISKK